VRCAALLSSMMRDLSRMGYTPKSPEYEWVVSQVMRVFEVGEAEKIELARRIEAADLLGQVGDPRLEEDNWVAIPGGTFFMGAQKTKKDGRNYDPEAYDNEAPVHEVILHPCRISCYLVTVQEFEVFVTKDGYKQREHWQAEGFGKFEAPEGWESQKKYPNRPVTGVSWFEAAAYCAWTKKRLPTEAEWEYAARSAENFRYPWGNEPPLDESRANYGGKVGHVTPVGVYPSGNTKQGLSDMLGNVWEWCQDWYGPYKEGSQENPKGPKEGRFKVMRGGSWNVVPRGVRVPYRVVGLPAGGT